MELWAVLGLTVLAASMIHMLRKGTPEIGLVLTVGAGAVLLLWSVMAGQPLFERITGYYAMAAELDSENIGILMKAVGICFLVQLGADACRDFGENALASKVELAGKITVLGISLPLFDDLLGIVMTLIG